MILAVAAAARVVGFELAEIELPMRYDLAWHPLINSAGYLGVIAFMFALLERAPPPVYCGLISNPACEKKSDVHSYWEFNPGTNWIFPHYELLFTGGVPDTFLAGMLGGITSIVPGSGPNGTGPRPFQSILGGNDPLVYGDNPDNPRDPDRAEVSNVNDPDRPMPGIRSHLETRLRFIPSRLTEEILFDVMVRIASFEPEVTDVAQRFFDAYAYEVSLIDRNGDGILSFVEADINGNSDRLPNTRLYLHGARASW